MFTRPPRSTGTTSSLVGTSQQDVWYAAVIMHNVIIEAEEKDGEENDYIDIVAAPSASSMTITFDFLLEQLANVQDQSEHTALRNDLVEHLWKLRGSELL